MSVGMKQNKVKTNYMQKANVEMAKVLVAMVNEKNVSQRHMARAMHISTNRINQILQGRWTITVDTDLRLCKFFGMEDGFFIKQLLDLQLKYAKVSLGMELDKIFYEVDV